MSDNIIDKRARLQSPAEESRVNRIVWRDHRKAGGYNEVVCVRVDMPNRAEIRSHSRNDRVSASHQATCSRWRVPKRHQLGSGNELPLADRLDVDVSKGAIRIGFLAELSRVDLRQIFQANSFHGAALRSR